MVNGPLTLFGKADLTTYCPSLRLHPGTSDLAFFNVKNAEVQPDRRVARRYVVDCPAKLALSGGDREGRLTDLSEHGARFETVAPPVAGTTGFLKWGNEDHYCEVIWAAGGRCGVLFDRPISLEALEQSCARVETSLRPVAAVERIPLGQRRSGRVQTSE